MYYSTFESHPNDIELLALYVLNPEFQLKLLMQPHISTSQFVSIPGTFLGSSSLIFRVSKIITSEKSLIIYDVMKSHYYHCVKSNLGRAVFSRNVLF